MKIVTSTGFYGTGSSAVINLLSEYDNVCCKGDYEIRIAHDPYGISDLEYNLIDNPNRHNSSNSLKKFIAIVNHLSGTLYSKRYESYFNGKFESFSKEYIDKLILFEYYGRWHYDLIERGKTVFFLNRSYNKFFYILKQMFGMENDVVHCLLSKKEPAYGTILSREDFLKATKEYFENLLNTINTNHQEIVAVDQLVPPTNVERYQRYFSDLYTVVVDRDPRDIFLLEKYIWKGHVVPHYDVEKFCMWFLWTRKQYEYSAKGNSHRIRFEDLVYDYENSIKNIENYIGLDNRNHGKQKQVFIPEESMRNTRLWEKYTNHKDEMLIIEKKLEKYCYRV